MTQPDNSTGRAGLVMGYYAALSMSITLIVTFGIAILTPPISGEFCVEGCISYPYLDIAGRFPRDYYWMYPAMAGTLMYVAFVAGLYAIAPPSRKIFGLLAVVFAAVAAAVLVGDYFVQVTVIQPSILKGEADGISLLTQYNPHGIFIALEELGYLLAGLSLLCAAPAIAGNGRLEVAIRWLFAGGWVANTVAFVWISLARGVDRGYLFEIVSISVVWLVLIAGGFLAAALFRRSLAGLRTGPR